MGDGARHCDIFRTFSNLLQAFIHLNGAYSATLSVVNQITIHIPIGGRKSLYIHIKQTNK